ncbi:MULTISPECIES: M23 family metallopeptidase [unclassified Paenibacillus]|uniref:M23 family metallopeptidase n=1 Tax=unclassified Paenibacillus TaxID=185978 RepID=UPI001AE26A55|nr:MULTISPECIES: M23 family metallopeptidase [unclassified Paenibacillus]MBP1155010.1 murein DD-endopeptidase MepM/ murein hydrolase activator NlpD [Paenibacillus sp. PvP091]MBP1169607.1 murein DD-endopeptidase MepM/ murein hydrolase activator NlpD [Paenibacillus sp. PvR098]MBP2440635.1 murein DD-endopeptidase MepM/ murein hydrolase activator NlpD [Paenibacillus sp. PvP052]
MLKTARIAGLTASLLLFSGIAYGATYTIQPEDSLWKIATKHKISVAALKEMNGLSSDVIYPGQALKVPGHTAYTVKNNESMWDISKKFGITLNALIAANTQIANPNNIWNGLTVFIPDAQVAKPSLTKPASLADGLFPLSKNSYQGPLVNNYSDNRSWSPTVNTDRKHEGVDIVAAKGTPVYSVYDGEIINFGWNEYGGYRVTVRVNSTTVFYYAHLSKYAAGIGKGSKVKKGQLLGYVGSTGYGPEGTEGKFEPHLHFGIYKTDKSAWYTVDPFPYLKWWETNR